MTVKTISLWQPWASLWVHGRKRIETRSWPFRGELPCVLAVHAAKRWGDDAFDICCDDHYRSCLEACGVRIDAAAGPRAPSGNLPLGCVAGLVRLTSCHEMAAPAEWYRSLTDQERAFGNYDLGRFGWIADRFHPFAQPYPLRGMQGVFRWEAPAEVVEVAKLLLEGKRDDR